jgi:RNA polymerase sigma factor (sigma-70 family)
VAEAYRLLHYEVEHGRIFYGRQVDIFLLGRFGDFTVHRAIECKAGPVDVSDLDAFFLKLHLVRRDYPAAQGTIVSGISFTDGVSAHAAAVGIQLTLFRDLTAQLLDGHRYAQSVLNELTDNQRYPLARYVEPSIGYDTVGDSLPAAEVITEWLQDGSWNQLTLLGDMGTGKTFLSRIITYRLLLDFMKSPLEKPLPVRIDLRNADREFSLEGLVITYLSRAGLSRTNFDVFQYLLSQGRLVLIFDGFDEMAARATPLITQRNFQELNRCVQGRAKVMLTCRTHYFRSQKEEAEVILGDLNPYRAEGARELYWELIARKGFRVAYLRPFQLEEIEYYVSMARPEDSKEALRKIRSTYNLLELSQRPLLLEMIVKSLDKLGGQDINASTLYDVFTDAWIHRDRWRDVMSPESKLQFLMKLAVSLWREDLSVIHHSKLTEYLQRELVEEMGEPQRLLEIDNEVRTASFLTRDSLGNYGFAHKSYMEFFLARHFARGLAAGSDDVLAVARLSPEVVGFLVDMIDRNVACGICEEILRSSYRSKVSENALLLLYAIRLASLGSGSDAAKVELVNDANLNGAQLENVVLSRAVLVGARLQDASLRGGSLAGVDLRGSNLERASLERVDFSGADLRQSSLRASSLTGANLLQADFRDANVEGTDFADTLFMQTAIGLIGPLSAAKKSGVLQEALRILGDEWALLEEFYPYIRSRVSRRAWHGRIDSEELLSVTILRLISSWGFQKHLLSASNFKDYADHVIRGAERDILVRESRSRESHLNNAEWQAYADHFPDDQDPEMIAIHRDLIGKISSSVSPKVLRAAWAFFQLGMSGAEIAEREGVSPATVYRRISEWRKVSRRVVDEGWF